MTTKRSRENLKTLVSPEEFDIKQQGNGVIIEGFANKATVDRGDELIATDAWDLTNYKKNPIILYNHGMDRLGGTPIGTALEVRPTEDGLYLKVRLSKSKSPEIQMIRDLVEERILRAFSVGFNPIETENMDLDGKAVRKITKAELFEVSVVGIPMNQDSLFSVTEKGVTTHAVKSLLLKEKGASRAAEVEELIGEANRKSVFAQVATSSGVSQEELLDMLAGNKDLPDEIVEHIKAAVKSMNLKETLEQALASLEEGISPEEVRVSLAQALTEEGTDEETEEDEEEPGADGEGEGKEKPKEEGADGDKPSGEGSSTEGAEGEGEPREESEEDKRRKADFQDCVAAKVPQLIEEGMDRDQAVGVAIAKCQEEGKCTLTPESKMAAFEACFEMLDAPVGDWGKLSLSKITFTSETKQVGEAEQTTQPPTTALSTEPAKEEFGSPFLEAAKQTNVLLGALISEIQGLRKEVGAQIAGATSQNSVQSDQDPSKGASTSESEDEKSSEHAEKAIADLEVKLKNLGY